MWFGYWCDQGLQVLSVKLHRSQPGDVERKKKNNNKSMLANTKPHLLHAHTHRHEQKCCKIFFKEFSSIEKKSKKKKQDFK